MTEDKQRQKYINLRESFLNAAETIDELIAASDKENAGEDVAEELQTILGKFMISIVTIQNNIDAL